MESMDQEEKILKIKASSTGAPDKLRWMGTKNGEYTTKSGYHAAFAEANSPELEATGNWNQEVLNLQTAPKVKNANLESSSWDTSLLTPDASVAVILYLPFHLFYQCEYAKTIWEAAPFIEDTYYRGNIDLREVWNLFKTKGCLPPTGVTTKSKAIAMAREWQNGQKQISNHTGNILQSDAAWNITTAVAGLGWIVKQNEIGIENLNVESDSKILINSILDENSVPELYGVVADILCIARSFGFVSFRWIPRSEKYTAADMLAKQILVPLRSALRKCLEIGIENLNVESDSKILINSILDENSVRELYGVVADILCIARSFGFISFRWIPRSEKYTAADMLAKQILVVAEAST
ncbi:hypothetical protein F2Q69_00002952 [Brassica cretica]|uniref:RNase H type-1 domain-containing protein n=1 Tax=Brassica cretica TaxID=69181 RepID=A0A8S9NX36_BRACR|nr:hypothetical protein F2Q69_00002952 [Brassica cretica]